MTQLLAHLFGDYLLQSNWMAQNKTKASWPAFCHALLYSLCFVPLCWVAVQHIPATVNLVASSSTCPTGTPTLFICSKLMVNTPSGYLPVAAAVDVPASSIPSYFRWLPWLAIFSTHFLIDRFRLARYVVWAKNFMAPNGSVPDHWNGQEQRSHPRRNWDWESCKDTGGYAPNTPAFMWVWLAIAADNTLHLAINYLALRWL